MFCQILYLTKTFSVDLPGKITNPVPAIQVRFQRAIRVTERFRVEGTNKCSDPGALW